MRIVAISDTHLFHEDRGLRKAEQIEVPDGDILIHAGDATFKGYLREIDRFAMWFHSLPHRHKIFIAGNHELGLEDNPVDAERHLQGYSFLEDQNIKVCHYLNENEVTVEGLRIYGSPWTPRFFDWAFNADRGPKIKQHWDKIPDGIDILVTHGPPFGHGDLTISNGHQGCEELALAVARVKPKLHIFGHIHPGYGVTRNDDTIFINASTCDESYAPTHPPVVIDRDDFGAFTVLGRA